MGKTTVKQDKSFATRLVEELRLDDAAYDWVIEWAQDNFTPDEVFGEGVFREWARDHGLVPGPRPEDDRY